MHLHLTKIAPEIATKQQHKQALISIYIYYYVFKFCKLNFWGVGLYTCMLFYHLLDDAMLVGIEELAQ